MGLHPSPDDHPIRIQADSPGSGAALESNKVLVPTFGIYASELNRAEGAQGFHLRLQPRKQRARARRKLRTQLAVVGLSRFNAENQFAKCRFAAWRRRLSAHTRLNRASNGLKATRADTQRFCNGAILLKDQSRHVSGAIDDESYFRVDRSEAKLSSGNPSQRLRLPSRIARGQLPIPQPDL
jgi:hypothetical protein